MVQKFSKVRCLIFVAILVSLFLLSSTYNDQLYEKSHEVIRDLQAGHTKEENSIKFSSFFSKWTDDIEYIMLILFIAPFLSRERFWYYSIAIQFASFTKINLKML